MSKCNFCGEEVLYPFVCSFCGSKLCMNHRLAENHRCLSAPKRTPLGPWYAKKPPMIKASKIPSRVIQPRRRTSSEGKFHFVKGEKSEEKLKIPIKKFLGLTILAIMAITIVILPLYAVSQLSIQCFDEDLDRIVDLELQNHRSGVLNLKVRFTNNGTFDVTLKNVKFTLRVLDSESNEQLTPFIFYYGVPFELYPELGNGLVIHAKSFRQYQTREDVGFRMDYQYVAIIIEADVSFFWYSNHIGIEQQMFL